MTAKATPERRRTLTLAAGATMLVASVLITRLGASDSALSRMTQTGFYSAPAYAQAELRALGQVPSSASLATTDNLLPHAGERRQIELIDPKTIGRNRYMVVNVLQPAAAPRATAATRPSARS